MSSKRHTIEIHIVMSESGAFVVDEDADKAAERAEIEFPDEEIRQVALTIELQPPSAARKPFAATVKID